VAANESSAVAGIRTLDTAQVSYESAYPTAGFAASAGSAWATERYRLRDSELDQLLYD